MMKDFENMPNGVYILLCSDNTFYIGMSYDIPHRVSQHQIGEGGRYTRLRLPVKLVFYENGFSRFGASRAESWIRKLDRKAQEELINGNHGLTLRLQEFKNIKQPQERKDDKLELIKEAVDDWREERLTNYSAMLIVSMIIAPKSELTREDVENAKELESLVRELMT